MAKSSDERIVLELLKNHAEFKTTLVSLTMQGDLNVLETHVHSVAKGWFRLAEELLEEASRIDGRRCPRSLYSRAYYAVYNASKSLRYIANGAVSLRGDDHKKISDLPRSFPDGAYWATQLPLMYEHRLRADYDNWSNTASENTLTTDQCLESARRFLAVAKSFLQAEYGVRV